MDYLKWLLLLFLIPAVIVKVTFLSYRCSIELCDHWNGRIRHVMLAQVKNGALILISQNRDKYT